jgi:hypothetical protein
MKKNALMESLKGAAIVEKTEQQYVQGGYKALPANLISPSYAIWDVIDIRLIGDGDPLRPSFAVERTYFR